MTEEEYIEEIEALKKAKELFRIGCYNEQNKRKKYEEQLKKIRFLVTKLEEILNA